MDTALLSPINECMPPGLHTSNSAIKLLQSGWVSAEPLLVATVMITALAPLAEEYEHRPIRSCCEG